MALIAFSMGAFPISVMAEEAQTIEELPDLIEKDIDDAVEKITSEFEQVKSENDTYEKYSQNHEQIEQLYEYIDKIDRELCIKLRERSVEYAKFIIASDKSDGDKYDDLEDLYDDVYDDAGDEVYDQIYDGILDDMYDEFYDGVLDDAYDSMEYKEWSDARSNEYKQWSDARSDAYEEWSDFRSDVYKFWSDVRSKTWSGDIEKAEKKISKFEDNIAKMKEKSGGTEALEVEDAEKEEATAEDTSVDNAEKSSEELVDGMRPEFKEAMDSYEEFYNQYCEFMQQYQENSSDPELLKKYADMVSQMQEMNTKFEAWNQDDLNTEELKYYLDVNNRVMKKLVEVTK